MQAVLRGGSCPMPKTIIPRWEWRTFAKNLSRSEELIRSHQRGNVKVSEEIYILSRLKNDNVKIRQNAIEVKVLKAVDDAGLEQWYPAVREPFPLALSRLMTLFRYMGPLPPKIAHTRYNSSLFLEEIVQPSSWLRPVRVHKNRHIYVINQCVVEVVDVNIHGVPFQTICVEHTDQASVWKTVRELGLEGYRNINYIDALKRMFRMVNGDGTEKR